MSASSIANRERGVCERCGEPAQFYSTEVTCEVGDSGTCDEHACAVTSSRSLCIRCAKADGEYPKWYVRLPLYVFSMLLYIILRPFRRTLRRRFQQRMNQHMRPDA